MRIHRNMYQTKEQEKNSSKELNGTEISNLPDKEFKTMVIKMLNKLGRRVDELSEKLNEHINKT